VHSEGSRCIDRSKAEDYENRVYYFRLVFDELVARPNSVLLPPWKKGGMALGGLSWRAYYQRATSSMQGTRASTQRKPSTPRD
jgi:hypothetical protein